jgi:hypothetical protein
MAHIGRDIVEYGRTVFPRLMVAGVGVQQPLPMVFRYSMQILRPANTPMHDMRTPQVSTRAPARAGNRAPCSQH